MVELSSIEVLDVMSRPVTIALDATLAEAEQLLETHGFNALPVVDDDGRLAGWLSSIDLLRAFDFSEDDILPAYEDVMRRPVSHVVIREILTVTPRMPLPRVLRKMVETGRKSFPVVDAGELVGVVSRQDVMRALRGASGPEKPGPPGSDPPR